MSRRLVVLCLLLGACASADQSSPTDATPIDAEIAPDACVPVAEVCDGLDQDCDDNIDETFTDLGVACQVGTGECTADGVKACSLDGTTTVCDATSGTSVGELCNGLDDDCDQSMDEGFNLGADCDGLGDTDGCLEGVFACDGAGGVTCTDSTASTNETCNGLDDDCVSGIDDPWPINTSCSAGVGACHVDGTIQCTGPSTAACNAVAGTATPEFCGDGIDQDCSGADVSCPTNDGPTGALDISSGGTFSVDMVAANDNTYTSGTYCGSTGGRDVYYQFTLPAAEVVYVDTFGSNFDTVERIHAGACSTSLGALQGCADDSIDACSMTYPVLPEQSAWTLAAGTYCLVIDQYSGSTTAGSMVLHFTRGGRNGTALPASPVASTTVGLTNVNTSTTCQPNASGVDRGYYFLVCPSTTRTMTANLCTSTTFDSILSMRSGSAGSSDLVCGDDNGPACNPSTAASFAATNITGPTLGWLIVDGWNGQSGTYTLTYTMP